MLWEKGYGRLWDLLQGYQNSQQQQQGPSAAAGTRDSSAAGAQQSHTTTTTTAAAGGKTSGDAGETSSSTADGAAAAASAASADADANGDSGIVLSVYGSGPNSDAIRERAETMGLDVEFNPATDHAELSMYKTFVNPSESEVLCTTVAEALAMGKFVVIAEHASNEFFYQFPNTLKFKTQEEFNEQVR